jgi:hypothetical protein
MIGTRKRGFDMLKMDIGEYAEIFLEEEYLQGRLAKRVENRIGIINSWEPEQGIDVLLNAVVDADDFIEIFNERALFLEINIKMGSIFRQVNLCRLPVSEKFRDLYDKLISRYYLGLWLACDDEGNILFHNKYEFNFFSYDIFYEIYTLIRINRTQDISQMYLDIAMARYGSKSNGP